jgi:hypothetical protein
MTRRDYYTNTEADAGRYEAAHHAMPDDRPTLAELLADEAEDEE